jgi:hypothetical protein
MARGLVSSFLKERGVGGIGDWFVCILLGDFAGGRALYSVVFFCSLSLFLDYYRHDDSLLLAFNVLYLAHLSRYSFIPYLFVI